MSQFCDQIERRVNRSKPHRSPADVSVKHLPMNHRAVTSGNGEVNEADGLLGGAAARAGYARDGYGDIGA